MNEDMGTNEGKEPTIEEMLVELDAIMEAMEKPDISLEESFLKYRQGMELLKACNEKIETVEKKMLVLDEEGMEHEF